MLDSKEQLELYPWSISKYFLSANTCWCTYKSRKAFLDYYIYSLHKILGYGMCFPISSIELDFSGQIQINYRLSWKWWLIFRPLANKRISRRRKVGEELTLGGAGSRKYEQQCQMSDGHFLCRATISNVWPCQPAILSNPISRSIALSESCVISQSVLALPAKQAEITSPSAFRQCFRRDLTLSEETKLTIFNVLNYTMPSLPRRQRSRHR